MKCGECEEILAASVRGCASGELPEAAAAHVARCASCREFRAGLAPVSAALGRWALPERGERSAAVRAALVARLAAGNAIAPERQSGFGATLARAIRHPGLIGVLGAAAAGAGASVSPGWVQQAVAGWAAGAAVLASLVLLYYGRPAIIRGEYR